MKYFGLFTSVLFSTLALLASGGINKPRVENVGIHRYIQIRFYPRNIEYRLHIITVVTNKGEVVIRGRVEDNIPYYLKLVRGENIWEGEIPPGKDSYDAGYKGYELLIPPEKGKKYIIQPAKVILKDKETIINKYTDPDTVIFDKDISDFWSRYDFYMGVPKDFHLEKEMREEHFLTFTGYPFDPRWIFIWWKDVKDTKIDGKTIADLRVKIGKELYDQEEDEVVEILPCKFIDYKAFQVKGNWKNPKFKTEGIFETYGFVDANQGRLYLIDIITFGYNRVPLNELKKAIRTFRLKESK